MAKGGILETIVGIIVIAIAALFLFYAFAVSGRTLGGETYGINAIFGRVDGLATGSDVRLAGVKVGAVSAFALDTDTYEAKVSMTIEDGIPIPDDTIAKIVSDGLLGGAHVALEPGASEFFLADGDSLTITQGSVDLLGLAVQAFTSNTGGGGGNNAGAANNSGANSGGGLSELPPLGSFGDEDLGDDPAETSQTDAHTEELP